jgi:hypothetical protein
MTAGAIEMYIRRVVPLFMRSTAVVRAPVFGTDAYVLTGAATAIADVETTVAI